MNIQKHLNWPISRGLLEFFRSCPGKVLHTSILTVKIRFVSLFRCPTRHLRTPSGPLGVPRLPPARSASVREMAQALSAPAGRRSKRRKVHIPVGRYPDRAAGPSVWIERSTVALPLQPWLGLSLARNRFEEIHDWYLQSPDAGPTAQGNNPRRNVPSGAIPPGLQRMD